VPSLERGVQLCDVVAGAAGAGVGVAGATYTGVDDGFGVVVDSGVGVEVGETLAATVGMLLLVAGAGFPVPSLLLAAADTHPIANNVITTVATLCRANQFFFVLLS
jgi:hypothetical protein